MVHRSEPKSAPNPLQSVESGFVRFTVDLAGAQRSAYPAYSVHISLNSPSPPLCPATLQTQLSSFARTRKQKPADHFTSLAVGRQNSESSRSTALGFSPTSLSATLHQPRPYLEKRSGYRESRTITGMGTRKRGRLLHRAAAALFFAAALPTGNAYLQPFQPVETAKTVAKRQSGCLTNFYSCADQGAGFRDVCCQNGQVCSLDANNNPACCPSK